MLFNSDQQQIFIDNVPTFKGFWLHKVGNHSGNILGQPIIVDAGKVINSSNNSGTFNGYLVDEDYFVDYSGGGGNFSSAPSSIDSSMVADMIAASTSSGSGGDWELLYDELNTNNDESYGTVNRYGIAQSDGFLYLVGSAATVYTGNDHDTITNTWPENPILQNISANDPNEAHIIPLKKNMSWHIEFHSTLGYITKGYFIPNGGGSASLANGVISGTSKSLKYPDGYNGTPITMSLSDSGYTVEEGKNLYILNYFNTNGWYGIYIDNVLVRKGLTSDVWGDVYENTITSPLIAGSGQNVSGSGIINGILVDATNIEPISYTLNVEDEFQGYTYTVPEEMILIITSMQIESEYEVLVDNVFLFEGPMNLNQVMSFNNPLVLNSNQTIKLSDVEAGNCSFNGYLVDKDYFESSSSSSASNSGVGGNSDVQITVSTTGDTLLIGSQTLIIPGISVANYGYSISGDIPTVYNPITGRVWMDRNLGASRVALSYDDTEAYGDLYQWGREQDGHEMRTSGITNNLIEDDITQHNEFIINSSYPGDWRTPQNANLWQGVNGIDNPCPNGFRLPTKDEWLVEIQSWNSADKDGAFSSVLKLTTGGYRQGFDGVIYNNWFNGGSAQGPFGYYWSSTVEDHKSSHMYFGENNANTNPSYRISIVCNTNSRNY